MDTIDTFIHRFNSSWLNHHWDELERCLDDQVIFIAPDHWQTVKGRKACIASIVEYAEMAKTIHFEVEETKVNRWENTAMVLLRYEIIYQMSGETHREKATELWTLRYRRNQWVLICRTFLHVSPFE